MSGTKSFAVSSTMSSTMSSTTSARWADFSDDTHRITPKASNIEVTEDFTDDDFKPQQNDDEGWTTIPGTQGTKRLNRQWIRQAKRNAKNKQ